MNTLPEVKIVLRELRGGKAPFALSSLAIAMATAAITALLCFTDSMQTSIAQDARALLGGDIEVRLSARSFSEKELSWVASESSKISQVRTTRGLIANGEERQLAYLKAVDKSYPLVGTLVLGDGQPYGGLPEKKDSDPYPAIVSPLLLELLGIQVGSTISIGTAQFVVWKTIGKEPDPNLSVMINSPPVIISQEGLDASGLDQPGSLVTRRIRSIVANSDIESWRNRLNDAFPDAGWRMTTADRAQPSLQRALQRLESFLALAALGIMLIAGIGVKNTTGAFLRDRLPTLATLKALGTTSRFLRRVYLMEIMLLSLAGVALGLLIGISATALLLPLLKEHLPVSAEFNLSFTTIATAIAYPTLAILTFSAPPLHRYASANPILLFSGAMDRPPENLPKSAYLATAIPASILVSLMVINAQERLVAISVIGSAVAILLFFALARLLIRLAAMYRGRNLSIKLAMLTLTRAQSHVASGTISFGLSLIALVALLSVQLNISGQIDERLREEAPSFYIIGVQTRQLSEFQEFAQKYPTAKNIISVPFLRGRISSLGGTSVNEIEAPEDYRWLLRGERGITWLEDGNSEALGTDSWAPTEDDGVEVSFDADAAKAFGLDIGDTIEITTFGETIRAHITHLRKIEWRSFAINFSMVFSPGNWQEMPHGYIAAIGVDESKLGAFQRELTQRFPNVTPIATKDVFDTAQKLLGNISKITVGVAFILIISGMIVLIAAVLEGQRDRIKESLVLRLLGTKRSTLITVFLLEFSSMAAIAVLPAIAIGMLVSHQIVTNLFELEWRWFPGIGIIIASSAFLVSILSGLISIRHILGQPPLQHLRNN